MPRTALTATLVATLVLSAVPLAGADHQGGFKHCGNPEELSLVFLNPDLRPDESDNLVHVTGTFFIQFQAIGSRAPEVEKIAFGFGKAIPEALENCDAPVEPLTALYIRNYRIDADGRDGFFVPINTTLVPDGEYAASITAFSSSDTYLGRFYTTAIVENGPECWPSRQRCADQVMPWPMILPGDGEQTNAAGGITIEFGEPIQDVFVRINGQQVIAQPWTPPARDDDAQPDNDGEDCGQLGEEPLRVLPVCRRVIWGSGFRVDQQPDPGDVIEVTAIDLAGNEGHKVVTVGGATQGGAIALNEPKVTLSANTQDQEIEAGESADYILKLVNVGRGEAEARMTVVAPEGLAVQWSQPTVRVQAGAEQFSTLQVTAPQDFRPGSYRLLAKATYKNGTDDQTEQLVLDLRISQFRPVPESPLRQARANTTEPQGGDADDGARSTPGAEGLLLLAGLGAAAWAGQRRRRG